MTENAQLNGFMNGILNQPEIQPHHYMPRILKSDILQNGFFKESFCRELITLDEESIKLLMGQKLTPLATLSDEKWNIDITFNGNRANSYLNFIFKKPNDEFYLMSKFDSLCKIPPIHARPVFLEYGDFLGIQKSLNVLFAKDGQPPLSYDYSIDRKGLLFNHALRGKPLPRNTEELINLFCDYLEVPRPNKLK